MKAVVAAFNQEKALVGAFSVITNLRNVIRMQLFEALIIIHCLNGQDLAGCGGQALPPRLEAELYSARLQLVIVSPVFLQWVYRNPALLVGRLLQQDRSVHPRKLPAKLSINIDNS